MREREKKLFFAEDRCALLCALGNIVIKQYNAVIGNNQIHLFLYQVSITILYRATGFCCWNYQERSKSSTLVSYVY